MATSYWGYPTYFDYVRAPYVAGAQKFRRVGNTLNCFDEHGALMPGLSFVAGQEKPKVVTDGEHKWCVTDDGTDMWTWVPIPDRPHS